MPVRFKRSAAVLVLLALGFSSLVTGQEAPAEDVDRQTERTPEEIIVYGKTSVIILQNALYRAEESFFDMFNALNSDDLFDVDCKKRHFNLNRYCSR